MSKLTKIFLYFVYIIGLVALFWTAFVYLKRRRRRANAMTETSNEDDEEMNDNEKSTVTVVIKKNEAAVEEPRKLVFVKGDGGFDLDELLGASAESLGQGSFGGTYKTMFNDGRAFVVKRLRDLSPLTSEEFGEKVRVASELEHPNLFPVIGYYHEKGESLLVYNLAPKGNLFDRIHGGKGKKTRIPFRWNSRLSIARSVAQALEFLHKHTEELHLAPHGNLKSSNVLLESDSVALVADYGFMPLMASSLAPLRLFVYRAPEYKNSRKLDKKSDVWCYGCLLLEILTGKNPSQSITRGGVGDEIVNWVHRAIREEWTCEVFDREICFERGALKDMFKLLQVALWCCEVAVDKRPDMEEVVREVDGIMSSNPKVVVVEEEEEEETETSSVGDSSLSNAIT